MTPSLPWEVIREIIKKQAGHHIQLILFFPQILNL
jgi:hypothetical protein